MGWADAQLENCGDFQALVTESGSYTSQQLHDRSCRVAAGLQVQGLVAGDRVVLAMGNGLELVLAFTAVIRAGAVAVIAPAASSAAGLREETGARFLLDDLGGLDTEPPMLTPVAREASDLAQIVYTSGTTGAAAAISWSHATVLSRYQSFRDHRPGSAPARRSLCALPLSSAFGAQYLYLRLLQKMELVLLPKFEPLAAAAAIAKHRVQATMLVPSMVEALLATQGDLDLSSLKTLMVGGSMVSPSLVKRVRDQFGIRLTTVYGSTELGPVARTQAGQADGSVGKIREGLELRVVDESGTALGAGQVGLIQVKAGAMAAVGASEWHPTGDLGCLEGGQLRLLGRSGDMIIQGGHNLHPQRICEALLELPEVRDCAVVGVPDDYLGEAAVAWVSASPGLTEAQILRECRARLELRECPVQVCFREVIPRSDLGKVERQKLRRETQAQWGEKFVGGVSELEQLIMELVRGLLGPVEEFGSFAEMGLDSLAAVSMCAQLSRRLKRSLSPTLVFNHPTPGELARHLLEASQGPERVALQPSLGEPVAIVGAGCRLPGGIHSAEAFWEALVRGADLSDEIARWDRPSEDCPKRASLLDLGSRFESEFFGLNPREARRLDPQHRLALEVAWHTLEEAGYSARELRECGLYLGISGTGQPHNPLNTPAMAVARVCRFLNLQGPSMAVDTTCSSGLVAVHSAISALRLGQCQMALAGGVNVIPSAESFLGLSQLQVLSGDGRSRSFEARADGFGRGEGCVLFLLKRLSEAQADGDSILAVIRGTAINHDGLSASLTAPSGRAQQEVIRAALHDGRVEPTEVVYLEAHGTGTRLGDPIEIEAAMQVLGSPQRVLTVGSVKANLGHLEAAAGAVGLLKAALMASRGGVPPQPDFQKLNPLLKPWESQFRCPTEHSDLEAGCLGVMSMGLSGSNAFAVLEAAPRVAKEHTEGCQILCVSARSEAALEQLRGSYLARLDEDWSALCATSARGGAHFAHRLAVVGKSASQLRERLELASRVVGERPKLAFLFTGQGVEWGGASQELCLSEPVFERSLKRCRAIFEPLVSSDSETALAQPTLFALEWSLAQLWLSWGIRPDVVAGHSLGELVAACVAGVFSLEDGLKLAVERGRLMGSTTPGGLLAVKAGLARVLELAKGLELDVAAVNGPQAVVMSGCQEALLELAQNCSKGGILSRGLPGRTAFHSRWMDSVVEPFQALVGRVERHSPSLPFVGCLEGRLIAEELCEPEYWGRSLRETVDFEAVLETLRFQNVGAAVELGPEPVLLGMIERELVRAPSLRADGGEREQMMTSLGVLYQAGFDPDWDQVYRSARRVPLPIYPFGLTEAATSSAAANLESLARAVVGRELGPDENLLEAGFDSLRVLSFLSQVRNVLGLELSVADFAAAPTLAGLRAQLKAETILWLREHGQGAPLLCLPPAGGGVNAFLRFPTLTQSPVAVLRAPSGVSSLSELVQGHAALLGKGGYQLFGWSFGAWSAHALAGVLESQGRVVEQVIMVDPPAPGRALQSGLAVMSVVLEHNPSAVFSASLKDYREVVEAGLLSEEQCSQAKFEAGLAAYHHDVALVPTQFPTPIKAPVSLYWANPQAGESWSSLSTGGVTAEVLGGDHYSVMRPPFVNKMFGS